MPPPSVFDISYLAFRLAPFIIVCSFVLQSIINFDIKGIVYLTGLMLACFLNLIFNSSFNSPITDGEINPMCSVISLGGSNGFYSQFPISLTVYSYTLSFLLTFVWTVQSSSLATSLYYYIPLLVVFILLIVCESIWVVTNSCIKSWVNSVGAIVIGAGVGAGYGFAIVRTKDPSLQFVNNTGLDICSRPVKQKFKCTTTTKSTK
jgi:hypothetical protein